STAELAGNVIFMLRSRFFAIVTMTPSANFIIRTVPTAAISRFEKRGAGGDFVKQIKILPWFMPP
ncbi:MAG TPA: hypothetical protein VFQ03_09655, partial [Candidatus Binatia bacterium]|nr:hypothetical protein [Candidatus Binatia bacterium]